MIKRLVRHGHSRVVLLDKKLLALLGWSEDQLIQLKIDGAGLVIRPYIEKPSLFAGVKKKT